MKTHNCYLRFKSTAKQSLFFYHLWAAYQKAPPHARRARIDGALKFHKMLSSRITVLKYCKDWVYPGVAYAAPGSPRVADRKVNFDERSLSSTDDSTKVL